MPSTRKVEGRATAVHMLLVTLLAAAPSYSVGSAGRACLAAASRTSPITAAAAALSFEEEVARRRNLAIISHPDAGKTTLTEKLLLYGGALQEAGAVKAKGERRRATSDFMKIEQDRGISISSTALATSLSFTGVSIPRKSSIVS